MTTIQMKFKKETKNTYRMEEVVEEGQDLVIGDLYVKKSGFDSKPDMLEITIKVI